MLSGRHLKPLPFGQFLHELLIFGVKQAWACLFAGVLIVGILATYFFFPEDAPLARYDFLFLLALVMQVVLLALKFERLDEARVIALYHVVGTVMELFKTAQGSWLYPEASFIRLAGVPLFSGFMYSTVGSYIARCWRLFDFRFRHYPPVWQPQVLALLIYVNFFTHHYVVDVRWVLFGMTALIYGRTWIWFTCDEVPRRMPLLLGFFLVAVFIWLAENIGTFSAIWLYPHQQAGDWEPVGYQKFGSWFLLMIISFVLVTFVHRPQEQTAIVTSPALVHP
jgi:uncharacterized membrane protein YoaT (DUF817 family)